MSEILVRLAVAAGLAALVGLDRELRSKPAGLRTNIVVAVAAGAFAHMGAETFGGGDPTRVASQVVSGIGFLGGGAIFASGGKPRGLTTAAALWGSAAIGIAAGTGTFDVAVAIVLVVLIALWPLDWLAERVISRMGRRNVRLQVIVPTVGSVDAVRRIVEDEGVGVLDLKVAELGGSVVVEVQAAAKQEHIESLIERLRDQDTTTVLSDAYGSDW